jgi:hypothetical protein
MEFLSYTGGLLFVALAAWFVIALWRSHRRVSKLLDNLGLDGVRECLYRLIEAREPGAYLIFEEMSGTKRFLQFRRNVGAAGATLTCDFPLAEWSQQYVPALQNVLRAKKIPFAEHRAREEDALSGFIGIEHLDVNDAAELADRVFRDVFGHESLKVRVWGFGVRRKV